MPDTDPALETERRRRLRVAAGVAGAVALLLAPFLVVDPDAALRALAGISAPRLAALIGLTALAMGLWGTGFRVVLGGLGRPTPLYRAVLLFVATTFLNNVTPLGQAGGDPVSGALVAESESVPYEVGLAGITALNALNRLAGVTLGVAGVAVLLSRGVAVGGIRRAAAVAVAATGGVLLLLAAGWRFRGRLIDAVGRPLDRVVRDGARRLPLVAAPAPGTVTDRVAGFVAVIERLAASPGTLAATALLGAAGHAAVAAVLWTAATGVGVALPPTVALAVVSAARVSGLTPTPGGAGSAVVVLSGSLVAVTGASAADATATALTYRAVAFWLPTVVGGLVAAAVVGRAGAGQ